MLTFLVKTTESLILASIMLGLIYAFLKGRGADKRYALIATVSGLAASIVMSYMKNATSRVDTGIWNLRIFAVSLAALVVFIAADTAAKGRTGAVVTHASLSVLIFTIYLYALPDVWAYPYNFLGTEQSALSTDFLYRLIGMTLGIVICLLTLIAIRCVALRHGDGTRSAVLKAVLFVNALRQLSVGLQTMLAKRLIVSNHTLFTIAKHTSNHSNVFIYLAMALGAMLPLGLLLKSLRVNEPYENPAGRRKIKARWIVNRRWSVLVILTLILSILNMTAVKAYDSREVELSPVEDAIVTGDDIKVPFELVEDGHLHRFGYVTDSGVQIRFIVIKKPNSSSYGIGLDACDICGETGYYEKDGQVVCKLCDVVMNINTIGFKGGCNPIVIDYSIHDGSIFVPIAGLLEHESEFKG